MLWCCVGQTLYGRVLWNPEQNLNSAYKLQLEKVYLCTGRDGYVPFFDPTGTLYNEGPQYGCIQPNKHLKHRFLLLVNSYKSLHSVTMVWQLPFAHCVAGWRKRKFIRDYCLNLHLVAFRILNCDSLHGSNVSV